MKKPLEDAIEDFENEFGYDEDEEFTCPECGSHYFIADSPGENPVYWTVYCNNSYHTCRFIAPYLEIMNVEWDG
jgi:hypothetical protein